MKSIILFQPRFGYYDLLIREIPLGLLSISRYLHQKYKITIIDQRVSGWQQLLRSALKEKPLCLGITCTTGKQIDYALKACRLVRSESNVPIVWGGIHPTLLPEQTLENPLVDIVVEGEGEVAFLKLIEALEEGKSLSDISGVWHKDGGCVMPGHSQGVLLDLDKLPPVPYKLIDLSFYTGFALQNFGSVFMLESSRGCPNRCTFCYNSTFDKSNWRIMSAEKIMENIKYLSSQARLDGINFVDDNFFASAPRTIRLIELMKKDRLNVKWACEASIEQLKKMDDTMLRDLEETGLSWMSIGIETGSEKIMGLIHKDLLIQEALEVNTRLKKFKIIPKYNFMCGFISETKQDLEKTTNLILSLLKNNPRAIIQTFNIAVPYPATKYYQACLEHGLSGPKSLAEWAVFDPDDWIDYCPWLAPKQKRLLKTLYVSSLFIDTKSSLHVSKRSFYYLFIRLIYALYHRIAKFRFSRQSSFFHLEVKLFAIFKRLFAGV